MIFTQFNNDSDNLSLLITQNTSARYVKIMMDILDLNGGFGYRVRPMGIDLMKSTVTKYLLCQSVENMNTFD